MSSNNLWKQPRHKDRFYRLAEARIDLVAVIASGILLMRFGCAVADL